MKKYYFISFMYGASEKVVANGIIDTHPFEWQRHCHDCHPRQYVLMNWKEISEEDYLIFKEIESEY